jgi:hypothetical protein
MLDLLESLASERVIIGYEMMPAKGGSPGAGDHLGFD